MRFYFVLVLCSLISACNSSKVPDVSHIKVDIQVQRFEQDFFALDTQNVAASLNDLHRKYPVFLQDFLFNILGLGPEGDSLQSVPVQAKSFIASYAPVKDSAANVFRNFNDISAKVRKGLQYVKYYFPDYRLPGKLITFIGPINSYGNVLTTDALAVGLQMYMGSEYSLYKTEAAQQLYPGYISRRFQPLYIPVNCMKNILDDMYPDASAGRPLVEQMIEAGKRLYLLDHFLPHVADTLKTGYTKQQLDGAYEYEEAIWSFFITNDLLFAADPAITKDYMNDAPNTAALGPGSPGFIGQFVGWQIVKKWMERNEKLTLQQLMDTDAKTIYEQAKYKP